MIVSISCNRMSMEASPHVKEDKNYMSFIQDFMFTTYYKQIIC